MSKLEFFWDVGSPYTYLATKQLPGLVARTGVEVWLRPFLLGGVFKSAGNDMPARVPAKAGYMLADLARWRDRLGVPLVLPPDLPFPVNSLLPMRVAVAAAHAGRGPGYMEEVFAAYWGRGEDVSREEVLAHVLTRAGLDAARTFAAAQTQPVKDELRANTDDAVRRGAFGAPTFFLGEQMFWGNDRLDFVEDALRR